MKDAFWNQDAATIDACFDQQFDELENQKEKQMTNPTLSSSLSGSPRTRLDYFNAFPELWKSHAIANTKAYGDDALHQKCNDAISALGTAFSWYDSPQGYAYWQKFYSTL